MRILDKVLFKFKNIHMLFIINVLLHSTGFDLRSSLAGNMALMTGVLSNIEK
jgi:hypothetical protein